MPKTIEQYQLPLAPGPFTVTMPNGSSIIGVGQIERRPCLWAEVDFTMSDVQVDMMTMTVGDEVPDDATLTGHFIDVAADECCIVYLAGSTPEGVPVTHTVSVLAIASFSL